MGFGFSELGSPSLLPRDSEVSPSRNGATSDTFGFSEFPRDCSEFAIAFFSEFASLRYVAVRVGSFRFRLERILSPSGVGSHSRFLESCRIILPALGFFTFCWIGSNVFVESNVIERFVTVFP